MIDGEYDTQGWNRFWYVKGNPIRYRDPTGHDEIDVNEICRGVIIGRTSGGLSPLIMWHDHPFGHAAIVSEVERSKDGKEESIVVVILPRTVRPRER